MRARDVRELPDGAELGADVCLIGSGPAGITLARELSGSGASVLLLESGGVAPDSGAARLVSDAHALLHAERPEVHGAPYGSDLRLLTAGGTPTVLYGPGDVRRAHAPDESVPVDDLVRTAQTLVLLLASVCGTR